MGRKSRLRQAKKKETEWSRVDLPPPPQFNGTNFAIWTSRMRVYLRYVYTLVELNDEAKDALALLLIQQALDESLMHSVASAKTSNEALTILRRKFSERGSSGDKTAEYVEEKLEGFASQANQSEIHSPVKLVDEEVEKGDEEAASPVVLLEDPAFLIADDDDSLFAETETCIDEEFATSEVAHEAATSTQLNEKKLIESLPMGAFVFSNNDLDCGCAGIVRIQRIAENTSQKIAENNEEEPTPETRYDEEILSAKELQSLEEENKLIAELLNGRTTEKEISAEINAVHVEKKMKDNSSKGAAEHNQEESSHIAVRNKAICIQDAKDEEMCIADAQDEDETTENIFQNWNLEEIRFYYHLMWQ